MSEEELFQNKLKGAADSLFSKLNDLEISYLLLINNGKNQQIKELQQRIDKAIKYIEQHSNALSVLDTISNAELLEILKGSDSNE